MNRAAPKVWLGIVASLLAIHNKGRAESPSTKSASELEFFHVETISDAPPETTPVSSNGKNLTETELSGSIPASPAAPRQTSLADLENLAVANNPTISAAAALIGQQEGVLRQETLYPNPTVGYLRSDADRSGQSATQGIFVSQDFVTAGKLRLAGAAGGREVEWRTWQLAAQRERVLNDVRSRFYEAIGTAKAVTVLANMEVSAVQGLRTAENLFAGRQSARADVLQSEIQLAAVRSALQDAKYRQQAANKQLMNVVGCPELDSVQLVGDLERDMPRLDFQSSLRRLLDESPVLLAQDALIQAAMIDVQLARAEAIPNVNVQVVAERDHVQKFNSASTLVSLPVPIFNRNQGNIRNAVHHLHAQQREYERIQLALRDQLAAVFQQYESAQNQYQRLRGDILPKAKEYLEIADKGYRLGEFDILRVINARQTYFETNLGYIDALTMLRKTVIEIDGLSLTGGLNPTEIGTALQAQPGAGGASRRSVLLQQSQQNAGNGSGILPGVLQGGSK